MPECRHMPSIEERAAEYRRKRYAEAKRLRAEWIAANGPCQRCGGIEDLLVDHIDPRSKAMQTSAIWMAGEATRLTELAKCQVLCQCCHGRKTFEDVLAGLSGKRNLALRTHCKHGHEYAVHGYRAHYNKGRICRECARIRHRRLA